MLKILILNAGWSNKGTYALTRSTMMLVRQHFPDVEFTLMGVETNQDKLQIKKQLAHKPFKNIRPWFYLTECMFINLCIRSGIKIPITKRSHLYEYLNCDIVINSGGDHLSGEFDKFGLTSYMNIVYAIFLRKPVILHGESLGNYTKKIYNQIAKLILSNVTLILVREDISKAYLDKYVHNSNVYVTADPAFILEPVSDSEIEKLLLAENIMVKRPLIGINPSGLIDKYIKGQLVDTDSIFAHLADKLIEELDANIILIPHVYTPDVDDRTAMHQVFELARNKHRIKLIENEYTAEELKGIIGRCDLFVGTRMHATIASTSMLVPTIGVAYSHKMHGIIGEMLEQRKYVINIRDLDYEILESVVFDAWQNRDIIKKTLEINIPLVKDRSMLNGKYIKHLAVSLGLDDKV